MEGKIIAEVGFNRDDDKKEFGEGDRIVRLFEDDELHFSFDLGRKEDDYISLTVSKRELLEKLLEL